MVLLNIKFNLLNLMDIIIYNNTIFKSYNIELINFSIMKLLIVISLLIYVKLFNKRHKFLNYKKISTKLLIFSYNLKKYYLK